MAHQRTPEDLLAKAGSIKQTLEKLSEELRPDAFIVSLDGRNREAVRAVKEAFSCSSLHFEIHQDERKKTWYLVIYIDAKE